MDRVPYARCFRNRAPPISGVLDTVMRIALLALTLGACYGSLHTRHREALAAWSRGDRAEALSAARALYAGWREAAGPDAPDAAALAALGAALDTTPIPPPTALPDPAATPPMPGQPGALDADLLARLASDDLARVLPAIRVVGHFRLTRFGPALVEVIAAARGLADTSRLTRGWTPVARAMAARAMALTALAGLAAR